MAAPAKHDDCDASELDIQDRKLFTPGPICVTSTVKRAMLKDAGSRDKQFLDVIRFIRTRMLSIAGLSSNEYTVVPMQGSGTFSIEAVFQTSVPRQGGKVLIFSGGAYGNRLAKMCTVMSIANEVIQNDESTCLNLQEAQNVLANRKFTHVAVVHCETSSGIINPVEKLGQLIKTFQPEATFIVDAMSSFGAVPLDLKSANVDFLVTSSNKCMEGVPGFGLVFSKLSKLLKCQGNSRSLSLDLFDQFQNFEKTGMFRFTPPTHVCLAFKQAIIEFEKEGGLLARAERYQSNRAMLKKGMAELGFKEYVTDPSLGFIITSFLYPKDPNFNFNEFYERLSNKGQVLYPGKLLKAECFRIGNIGQIFPDDIQHLLQCIAEVCADMRIKIPLE